MIKQTLYFGNPTRLYIRNSQLCMVVNEGKTDEEKIITRPIEDIGMVIIDSAQISLTSSVASMLMENGAALIVCDKRHLPSGLMLNIEGHTLQSERIRDQISVSLPLKKQLWAQTVSAKIINQSKVLEKFELDTSGYLEKLVSKIKSGDSSNIEARAASYYWKLLLESFPAKTRRRDGDSPNELLNYGYTVVRAIAARAISSVGLHPSIGLFHKNKYNAYCLADDIMEPYRPYVDIIVMELNKSGKSLTLESKEIRKAILEIITSDVRIGEQTRPLALAMNETASSLYKCFSKISKTISYPQIEF